ncbi:MAG: hypothetical protein M0T74_06100 [Desulfitobacterium hafniense]|nr:hypothetical protein [Desulfitobacterium hafniense]
MKSGQLIGGLIAGSIIGAAVGFSMSPKRKSMSMMRKGWKAINKMM